MRPGSIELMQSRRLNYDDQAKKGVILREEESVQATYYMQVFDRDYEHSEQRLQQIRYENPIQYFFNFDFLINAKDIKPFS